MKEKSQIIRVYLVYVGVLLFAVAIFSRILYLQLWSDVELKEEVEQSTIKLKEIVAPRGNIFADNDQKTALALSVPRYDIRMDLVTVDSVLFEENVLALADSLSDLFGGVPMEWEQGLRVARAEGDMYYSIKNNCTHIQLQRLETFPILEQGQFRGGYIKIPKTIRVTPFKQLASRTIGYYRPATEVSKAYAVGLEGAYNKYLQGVDGELLMERIGGLGDDAWKPIPSEMNHEPIPGKDVYTTIDVNIQDVAHSALMKQMIEQNAQKGCAVLMEVETGYIKAIANLSKDTVNGGFKESFNHAVGMASEPGSTSKLASLMVALDDEVIRITDSIDMPGKYCFYGTCLHDSRPGGYGKNTIQYAFEVSSNVISKIINDNYATQPQMFVDGLKEIGIHKPLGLDIAGEGKPVIKDASDETFSGISLPWMAIGYEVLQTPLQTLALYNAVANNGMMVKPQFVKEIRMGNEVVEEFPPVVLNPMVCKVTTLLDLQKLLKGVVERGTAKNIKARGFEIAGKTGTAKIAEKGGYSDKYQASFVGYFPADAPKYSCVVVIQGPTKQIYGSAVSGTVFKEIADKVYASGLENTRADMGEQLAVSAYPYSKNGDRNELKKVFSKMGVPVKDNSSNANYVATITGDNNVELSPKQFADDQVPSVIGMGLIDAMFVLESRGLSVQVNGSGIVKNQSINPGTKLVKGQLIELDLI
ncbi:penicillin-binding protein [Parvicella tangerina]|uniref:Peptidoglycan D,D-transpeptidase FtsI n=1 Tax=Parvicella tangerina TaxID=2829795 RepID=A0A916JPG8_9FLAO|nr:penicillin-binding protein [Parvicella tangerina]CAG5085706.1 Peptidoglycan D,D-transpeptidase FtsI [Parvicella tangerina]